MQRNRLKSGLLLSTSLMTAALGYSRRAYAACNVINSTPTLLSYGCVGINTNSSYYQFSDYGNRTLVVNVLNGTVFSTDRPLSVVGPYAANQITITGDGNLNFNGQSYVFLEATEPGYSGVVMQNIDAGNPGNVTFSQAYADPTYDPYTQWGIFGTASGVTLINNANGNITATVNGNVGGEDSGFVAEHNGTGNIVITTGNNGLIEATGTDPTDHALIADHNGTGSITLTLNGDATAAVGNAVNATTDVNGTGITVNIGTGDLEGGATGLFVDHNGTTGGVTIVATSPTAPGTMRGETGDGIYAANSGADGITITTGAGAITGGAAFGYDTGAFGIEAVDDGTGGITITVNDSDVSGDPAGVRAFNQNGGSVNVTANGGDITGANRGIGAYNIGGTGSVTVTTGDGAVSGGIGNGVFAQNTGSGGVVIETGSGTVTGGANPGNDGVAGIVGYDSGAGGIQITVNDSDVTGDSAGVLALNYNGGSVDITTYAGNILGEFGRGLDARNIGGTGAVTIETGAGTVTGNTGDGVFASNTGSGGIEITTGSGAITGGADPNDQGASGIEALDYGSGGITITVNDSDVTGDSEGVRAFNVNGGSVVVTTNAGDIRGDFGRGIEAENIGGDGSVEVTTGSGTVTGDLDDGISAFNTGSGGIEITTGTGAITGGADTGDQYASGIDAVDVGAGGITITVNDSDVTGDSEGVRAFNVNGGSIVITTNAGDISGTYGRGIEADNSGGDGSVEITTGAGTVTGGTDDGISARNTGSGGVEVTTGTGAIIGGAYTGDQYASGIEAADYGTGSVTITVNDSDVTGDSEGIRAFNVAGGTTTITTYAGNIRGDYGRGIEAFDYSGAGAITITTGTGTVTGDTDDGIFARSVGTGGITIETGSGAITGGADANDQGASGIEAYDTGSGGITITVNDSDVTGDSEGIRTFNVAGGTTTITTYAGNIRGDFGRGIEAFDYSGAGAITITTGTGTVTGDTDDGIFARNTGSGGITIETGSGAIIGGADPNDQGASGIEAFDSGSGGITITVNDSNVTGDGEGVRAENVAGGSIEITTNAGNILGTFGRGIEAINDSGYGGIEITTGSGTVTGNLEDGISANNFGDAGIIITTGSGNITGGNAPATQANAYGIRAVDNGNGDVTITVNDSNVTGDGNGVFVQNYGAGETTVDTNNGNIEGVISAGIAVINGPGSGDATITTRDGTVTGGLYGIQASVNGTGLLTITTGDGDITGTGQDGIRGAGAASSQGVTITLTGAADVTGGDEGISAYSAGGSVLVDASAATGVITGQNGNGIEVITYNATGDVTVITGAGYGGVAVDGQQNGIRVYSESSGLLSITTGDGSVTGTDFDGIYARNQYGTGITITTGSGDVSGNGDDGIDARNYTGNILINTYSGDVEGADDGIYAYNQGDDGVEITTRDGLVSGIGSNGIEVEDWGYGGVVVTTGAGDSNGDAVYGLNNGISVRNYDGGSIEITTADGNVTGANLSGIFAYNDFAGEGIAITVGGAGNITGGANGITASNLGAGGTTVDASGATGVIEGETIDGINVYNGYGSIGGITITTGAGDGTDAVIGFMNGIDATNRGVGSISITTGTGAVTGTGYDGIRANQNVYGEDITITTGTGTVRGGQDGIDSDNLGSGDTTITTYGQVIGEGGDGIQADNGGDGYFFFGVGGSLTITTNAYVQGQGGDGIQANNDGSGALTITTNDVVRGDAGNGITATNGSEYGLVYGTNLIITANDEVSGSNIGISAINEGTGYTSILTEADVTGEGGDGIFARNGNTYNGDTYGTNLTITTNGGVFGQGGDGIDARNTGSGELVIETNGVVDGDNGNGILAQNGYNAYFGNGIYGTNLVIETTDTVTGSTSGIVAVNIGTGFLTVDAGADVIGENGDGIRASNGTFYDYTAYGTDLTIITDGQVLGQGGDGIEARNRGAGELRITTYGIVDGDNGNGILASNGQVVYGFSPYIYGTNIVIETNESVTGSLNGISATNIGSGYTQITTNAAVEGEGGDGIFARNGTYTYDGVYGTDLRIYANETVTGSVDGIDAANTGTGELLIITEAEVTGDTGSGIVARNGFYYFNAYGTNLTIETNGTVTGALRGIDAINTGTGFVDITVGGDVTGETVNGIFAQNSENGTTLDVTTLAGTTVTGRTEGILAVNFGSGIMTVDVQGDEVTGTLFGGVVTSSYGSDTAIVISGASTVQGGFAAIVASSVGGALIDIDNAGVLQNLSGLDTSLVVSTTGGETDLTNTNQLTGRIEFGAFDDILTNSGTWLTGGTSDFGGGTDALSNANLLIAANQAGVSETTTFTGLESFSNSGVIDLSDETVGNGSTSFDTLSITGDFTGVAGTLQLDASLGGVGSDADTLVIAGTASGTTAIEITNTNAGSGGSGANILLVDTGGSTGSEFFLAGGPISVGAYVYDLFWDGEDFYLQSALDVLRLDAATFPAILGDIWEITAGGWHRNTQQLQSAGAGSAGVTRSAKDTGAADGNVVLGWGTLIVDTRDGDGTIIADVGGSDTPVDVSFDQNTRAFVGGVDVVLPPDANGGTFTIGALLGVVDSSVDYDLTGNSAKFDGLTYGLHVAYATDAFRADLIVKRDDLDLEYTVGGLATEPGRSDASSTGASLEFGYKIHETAAMSVEAVGNLSHVSTKIDAFTVGSSTFAFDSAETTRGAIGLTFRGNYVMGSTNVTPSATLKYWNVFDGGYTSAIDAVAFSYDGTGSYVEASATLEFDDPDSGWSGFVSGSGFLGGERSGARAQIGLNLKW